MNDKRKIIINILLTIIILIVLFILFTILLTNKEEDYNYQNIIGNSYTAQDDSYLVLNKDKTFYWYKDKDNKDEYYYGTYSLYRGENAISYISKDLAIYDISEEKQRTYLQSQERENIIDYYYCLVLNNKKLVTNDNSELLNKETKYYGLADIDYKVLTFTNMDANNSAIFTR